MYASKKANWHLVIVIFLVKHWRLFVKVNKASKMADKDGRHPNFCPTVVPPAANPFRDTRALWFVGSLLIPLLPLRFSFVQVFEYNYELKQKPSINRPVYTAMSSRVNMNTSQWPLCTCQQSFRELQWAENNKIQIHRPSWPSTSYSSMPYLPFQPAQPLLLRYRPMRVHASYLFRLLPTMLPPPQLQKHAPTYSAAPV